MRYYSCHFYVSRHSDFLVRLSRSFVYSQLESLDAPQPSTPHPLNRPVRRWSLTGHRDLGGLERESITTHIIILHQSTHLQEVRLRWCQERGSAHHGYRRLAHQRSLLQLLEAFLQRRPHLFVVDLRHIRVARTETLVIRSWRGEGFGEGGVGTRRLRGVGGGG
jgi:hypothetical protein